ncbi:MAG TPA: hypothetical protein VF715_10925 [Thermoleophilaceae bacterium]
MSSALEQVFWRAVDDLNAGRVEPVERYLELVASDQRDELAEMLATVLATRGPAVGAVDTASEGYARALAAIDEVAASSGATGMLPGALRTMRHARGIEREAVVAALAEEHGIAGPDGRKALERYYHRLESGQLLGTRIARRLLVSLARIFDAEPEDLIAGARPAGPGVRPWGPAAPAMGRGGADERVRPRGSRPDVVGRDPEVELVERLFTGGSDA